MSRPLAPELHDVGKLYRLEPDLKAVLGVSAGYLHQNEVSAVRLLGLAEPDTQTWQGIAHHHDKGPTKDRELFALAIADHIASSVARGPEFRGSSSVCSIHKLWRITEGQPLADLLPPSTVESIRDLVAWLENDPDASLFFTQYSGPLRTRPEDLTIPRNTVSLDTHCTLVGKVYRFLMARLDAMDGTEPMWSLHQQAPQNDPVEAGKGWRLCLVSGHVAFPQSISRTRDMAAFDLLAEQMASLAMDDRVVVTTFDQLLAICASEDDIADLLAPLSAAGLAISWQAAHISIEAFMSSPAELRKQYRVHEAQNIEQWWARIQANWQRIPESTRRLREAELEGKRAHLNEILVEAFPRGIAMPPLVERIAGRICDVCQLEPATRRWPDDPMDAGPFEEIGERCYALRQRGARLAKLSAWTEEPACRVMWGYVGLDLDRLVTFLRPLLTEYARPHVSEQQLQEIDVRPPLLLEFQKDYTRFLQQWAEAVENYVGAENVEHVGGSGGLAGNSLLCLRLSDAVSLPRLLELYRQAVEAFFPVCLPRELPVESRKASPFRLYLGVSGVKFPFSEHWRLAQEADTDLLIHIVGQGSMRAPLPALPKLLEIARSHDTTALHNLAEVAKISEALADLHLENRSDERHYDAYRCAMNAIRPLNMSHRDLIAFARILEG